jgi:hypothetical protein
MFVPPRFDQEESPASQRQGKRLLVAFVALGIAAMASVGYLVKTIFIPGSARGATQASTLSRHDLYLLYKGMKELPVREVKEPTNAPGVR